MPPRPSSQTSSRREGVRPITPTPNRTPTPSRSTTPSAGARFGVPNVAGATASPQIRAALASMRSKSLQSTPSTPGSNSLDVPSTEGSSRTRTIARASSNANLRTSNGRSGTKNDPRERSSSTSASGIRKVSSNANLKSSTAGKGRDDDFGGLGVPFGSSSGGVGGGVGFVGGGLDGDFGLERIDSVVQKARTSGRLIISSRSMASLPPIIFSDLLPRSSIYHPSNRAPPSQYSRSKGPNLAISSADDDTKWYEQTDLKTFKASNNELTEVDEAVGGFEQLVVLDLHNNQIPTLPLSIGLLTNLTSLSLAANNLAHFPLQLLALENLNDLDLSSNKLVSLWPSKQWKEVLRKAMDELNDSNSSLSGETDGDNGQGGDFWSMFPSSPQKPRSDPLLSASVRGDTKPLRQPSGAPWQKMKCLKLGGNRFKNSVFAVEGDGFLEWPPRLEVLELSKNAFMGPLPADVFGKLEYLSSLDLSGNQFAERIFSLPGGSGKETFFPSLISLDLSANAIDSLEMIEDFFAVGCRRKRIDWKGLSASISAYIRDPEGGWGDTVGALEIKVADNMLRDEARRRRDLQKNGPGGMKESNANGNGHREIPGVKETDVKEVVGQKATPVVKEAWELEAEAGLLTEGGRRRAKLEEARKIQGDSAPKVIVPDAPFATESPTVGSQLSSATSDDAGPAVALDSPTLSDPAYDFIKDFLDKTADTCSLSNRKIASIPRPQQPSSTIQPSSLDLSKNLFTSLPIETLSAWGWTSCLRKLNLSQNRIAAVELMEFASERPSIVFESLEDLNLASNGLTEAAKLANGQKVPLFQLLSGLAPNMKTLDLTYNLLVKLDEVKRVLVPALIYQDPGRIGLKNLKVVGNRLEDLEGLAEVGDLVKAAANEDSEKITGWVCTEIDVRDNAIGRLPVPLGYLPSPPLENLFVTGNTFRTPNRTIYELGGPRLLKWLKDRTI